MSHLSVTKQSVVYLQPSSGVSVFRGVRNDTNTPVAIKEQTFGSVADANKSIREAMNQTQLTHPNVCQAYDCYLEQRNIGIVVVIVMELMDKDLNQEICERQQTQSFWSEDELLTYLSSLLSALRYAETRGVSHRDIKPQNIFLKDGIAKLGDFGSSGCYLDIEKLSKSLQGTPFFLSPELKRIMADMMYFAGQDIAYDPFKADVYSLGITFLYMARLKVPDEIMNLNRLADTTQRLIGELTAYPRLSYLLVPMLSIAPESRISFEQLDVALQSLQRDAMQTLQSLPVPDQTLKPCIICSQAVLTLKWTSHIPADCCRYWDFFSELCSLQCLIRMKAAMEERGATDECLWCLNPQRVVRSEQVFLPCGHVFHEKLCLFSFLRCMSENFNVAIDFKCPKCYEAITREFIDEVIGRTQYQESMYVFKSMCCMKCGEKQAVKYCRYQHIFCEKCVEFFLYFIPKCPVCQALMIKSLPKSDSDLEVSRILKRARAL